MADEKKYKIVGVWGLLPEDYSESVFPVYREEGDGDLYFASGDRTSKGIIFARAERVKESAAKQVRMLDEYPVLTNELDQEVFKIGDPIVYPFRINENSLYIGPLDKYLTFLVSYRESVKDCSDEVTLSQLDDEIEELTGLMNSMDKDKNIEPIP